MEIPYTGHATIDEGFDNVKIMIPTKRNWFIILFLGAWLGGWAFGESFALRTLIVGGESNAPNFFLFFWLIAWTTGGLFAFRTFFWMLTGKELIIVQPGLLTLDKKGALFYKAKTYDLRETTNFRAQEESQISGPFGNMRMNNIWTMKSTGTIRFDYGMQTVKFADGIDEVEANFILQKLRDKRMLSDTNFNKN